MVNLDRIKRKSPTGTMGVPPSEDEASNNLQAPEVAPAAEPPAAEEKPTAAKPAQQKPAAPEALPPRIDGRTMRRSGRVVTLATRVTPEFDAEVRQLAQERGLLIVEVLEEALAAYKKAIS